MARTSTPRGDVAKERILQHALQIFSQRGFDGFTTRELSSKAKVNIAAINYYFGHKQGLYDAVVDEVYARLKERGEQAFAAEVAPMLFASAAESGGAPGKLNAEQLRSIVTLAYRITRSESVGVRILVRQVLDAGHLSAHTEKEHFIPAAEMATNVVSKTLGLSVERARANNVAFAFLLSRYVVQDENSLMTSFAANTPEQLESLIVDTLIATVCGGAAACEGLSPAPPWLSGAQPGSPPKASPLDGPDADGCFLELPTQAGRLSGLSQDSFFNSSIASSGTR